MGLGDGIGAGQREGLVEDREQHLLNDVSVLAGPDGSFAGAWTAKMIRPLADKGVETRASFLRGSFTLSSLDRTAKLRISALGLYRAFINGKRVGHDQLTPGWTVYTQRLSFQTYDVWDLLVAGENTVDIWLGDGWLRSQLGGARDCSKNTWGSEVAAIAELSVAGDTVLATDTHWRSGLLPITKSGIYLGEHYDAREENLVVTDGCAVLDSFDESRLIPHEITPVQELKPFPVFSSFKDSEGRTVYDFAQNIAGYVSFVVRGERGAKVVVEHAEILDENRQFYNVNYRSAEARIEYTLRGGGDESFTPTFTFFGFRYARITITGKAVMVSIQAIPITSAIKPAGQFTSGSALVNRLVQNTIWSQRGNFIEVPTDCPQRDERLGWTGDAQVFAGAACYLNDSHDFLCKYLRDMMVDQRPDGGIAHVSPDPFWSRNEGTHYGSTGWGDAIVLIPWTLYLHYGDRSILEECFDAMVRWNSFVWSISDGPIVRPPQKSGERGFTFGDWLQPQGDFAKPYATIGDDAAATIYLLISTDLIARIAALIGREDVARRMMDRAAEIKTAFQKEFITATGRIGYNDQTSYALAFLHGLIPAEHIDASKGYFREAVERANRRIGTGFIGTPALLPALLMIGEAEIAAAVFLQEEVPGWLAQVKRGATTIWERWDGIKADGSIFEPRMNSYNHYAYGAVCQWLFESVAGFRPDPNVPGFKHIVFEPTIIPALSPVAADHDSVAGHIEARWAVERDKVTYDITVPDGANGTLVLAPTYRDIVVDGIHLSSNGTEKVRSPLAPGPHTVMFRIDETGSPHVAAAT